MTTEQLIADLANRFDRVERAILGDETVGHIGLVTRTDRLEEANALEERIHADIDERRLAGDRRAHNRIDELEENLQAEITSVGKKIDRAMWLSAGAFIGGFGIGSWAEVGRLFTGG